MRYQYQLSSSNYETITIALFFNHSFSGWLTLPNKEMENFVKTLKARRTRNKSIDPFANLSPERE